MLHMNSTCLLILLIVHRRQSPLPPQDHHQSHLTEPPALMSSNDEPDALLVAEDVDAEAEVGDRQEGQEEPMVPNVAVPAGKDERQMQSALNVSGRAKHHLTVKVPAGDSVLWEFNVEEPLSDAKIKASIEESLLSSSIDGKVSVVVANGKAAVQLTLTGQAGIALRGIEVTQDDADSTPLNVSVSSTSVVGVDFFKMVSDFSTALSSDTRSNIDRAISELSSAQEKIAGSLGEIGSKLNTLERQKDINADLGLRVDQMLSSEEDLDYAKAVTQFNAELVRLEATQASFAKVAQLSLFQFI